jgi:hypothetical protein
MIIFMAVYYIDPQNGNDANSGLSPDSPLLSHDRIALQPGDSLLFKRGSITRSALHTTAGAEGAPVTYGAYGEGEPPVFCASVDLSSPDQWVEVAPNVWQCTAPLPGEVGNFIFDGDRCEATLRWERDALCEQGDFWDSHFWGDAPADASQLPAERALLLYSKGNPALFYRSVEAGCSQPRVLASPRDYTVFEDLCFRNHGLHGLAGAANHVTVRRCRFENLGGCVWSLPLRIRFGNAVEFYGHGSYITVEDCVFRNVYDSCVTHQGPGEQTIPTVEFICRNNTFDTYGMAAFEYRDKLPIGSIFANNDCQNAGCGFAMRGEDLPRNSEIHPLPMGHHIFLWRIPTPSEGGSLRIEGNRFGAAPVGAAIYSIISPEAEAQITLDHNTYTISNPQLLNRFGGIDYTDFTRYRTETGQDAHSAMEDTQQ